MPIDQIRQLLQDAEVVLAAERERASALAAQLHSVRRTGEALGLIMGTYQVTAERAEVILAQLAHEAGLAPAQVAEQIIATHCHVSPHPVGADPAPS